MSKTDKPKKIALILTGGGARAAYQVGVLKAISELAPKDSSNPFHIIIGTSAGAINSAALAIYGARFCDAVMRLQRIWRNFHVSQVFRSDFIGIMKSGAHWLLSVMLGGLGKHNPASFLDRAPLRLLLAKYLPCQRIKESIDSGVLESIGITASAYGAGRSVVFYHTSQEIAPWERSRRIGRPEEITIEHLMASSAIPFIFSAIRLGNDYYGDGSMRQIAPISPAVHMGADKILVIGVANRRAEFEEGTSVPAYPSLAQIGGHILNSIFIDSLETDLERLRRVNKTIELIPSHQLVEHDVNLRPVDVMIVSPSEDLQAISMKHYMGLPRTIRFFLRGVGAVDNKGSSLMSYLMFEKYFCRELINLGYKDAMSRKDDLIKFIALDKNNGASD
ncbi:MAG: patatin-like phospholipase family protein [Gammaproteobacteria bacterium]|nr:patatin-like phospholipase family protein [Gammaproteobacteria bacterium]MDH5735538.1 patatin-like phospholipase family protein [Gammaproteobacteria bacterium]